jgi:hypothetical protein
MANNYNRFSTLKALLTLTLLFSTQCFAGRYFNDNIQISQLKKDFTLKSTTMVEGKLSCQTLSDDASMPCALKLTAANGKVIELEGDSGARDNLRQGRLNVQIEGQMIDSKTLVISKVNSI